jgi:hypothetical protein
VKLLDVAKEEAGRRARGEPPLELSAVRGNFAERTGQARRFLVGQLIIIAGGLMILANWLKVLGDFSLSLSLGGLLVSCLGRRGSAFPSGVQNAA